jgi:ADP-heptose:LPS heptosyltransferase
MCICLVAGDVVENLLFFPVLEQLRRRYPGVIVDIFANERGKQAYELNWIVRRTNVVPFGDEMLVGAEYADFVGKMKVRRRHSARWGKSSAAMQSLLLLAAHHPQVDHLVPW